MKKFPSGAQVDIFETLDSTSLEAKRRTGDGQAGPRWFIALAQTAGYGRRGRGWVQATGDFAGTLLFRPEKDATDLGQLSFVAALSLASALDEVLSPQKISLKWPNDILIDGAKAAGILLERFDHGGNLWLAIGIGVNIVSAPVNVAYPTARLMDHTAPPPSPEQLGSRIDHHFWVYYQQWRSFGFGRTRQMWLERAQGVGAPMTVRLPNKEYTGVFTGLDETGALILQSGAEKRIISAGDVFFGPKAGTSN